MKVVVKTIEDEKTRERNLKILKKYLESEE